MLGIRVKNDEFVPARKRLIRRNTGAYRSSFMDFSNDLSELGIAEATPQEEPISQPPPPQQRILSPTGSSHSILGFHLPTANPNLVWWFSFPRTVFTVLRRRRGGKAEKVMQGIHEDPAVNTSALERALKDSLLRDNLVDRLLAEHCGECCIWLRFIIAVNDYERTHSWKRKHEKGRRIALLFVKNGSKYQLTGIQAPSWHRSNLRRTRFSQFSYLVKLKGIVCAELLKNPVVQRYLQELFVQDASSIDQLF